MGKSSRTSSLLALAVLLALISGVTAIGAWAQNFSSATIVDSEELISTNTPLLSVRRFPNTLQGTVGVVELSSDVAEITAELPATACITARSNGTDLVESLNPETPLLPASNLKLVTTWAALRELGANFRYQTLVTGQLAANGTATNVTVIGGGDPFLATQDWISQFSSTNGRTFTEFEGLVEQLIDAGVTQINGNISVDESRYDSVRVGPWAQRLVDQNQSGPLSALAVNEGFDQWGNELNLGGRVRSANPAISTGQLLANLLSQQGVEFTGEIVTAQTTDSGNILAQVESAPLSEIVTYINSYSSNFGAELLIKEIAASSGETGSTAAGANIVSQLVSQEGFTSTQQTILDGSGLSEQNLISCELLRGILETSTPALADSLAISGKRGSLEARFGAESNSDGLIEAKTGTLRSATALSGYSISPEDDEISTTFTIIANEDIVSDRLVSLTSDLALEFSRFPEAPALEELGPQER